MSCGLEELAGDLRRSGFYLSPLELRRYSSLPPLIWGMQGITKENTEVSIEKEERMAGDGCALQPVLPRIPASFPPPKVESFRRPCFIVHCLSVK